MIPEKDRCRTPQRYLNTDMTLKKKIIWGKYWWSDLEVEQQAEVGAPVAVLYVDAEGGAVVQDAAAAAAAAP